MQNFAIIREKNNREESILEIFQNSDDIIRSTWGL